ncbi:hypothetical protein PYCC9005_005184 [Savitreella phatthalungensis]
MFICVARYAATRLRYDAHQQALQESKPTDWAERIIDELKENLATVQAILASTAPHAYAQAGGRARSPVQGRRKCTEAAPFSVVSRL